MSNVSDIPAPIPETLAVTPFNMKRVLEIPVSMASLPSGWLTGLEASTLYTTSRVMPQGSRVLEVGSWIGRSTCSMAYGFRDSFPKKVQFDVIDFGIAGAEEWKKKFNQDINDSLPEIRDPILTPGGVPGILKKNLAERGLSDYVSLLIFGDLANYQPRHSYDFVFCDATHGLEETKRTIALLAPLLSPDHILICHDMHENAQVDTILQATKSNQVYLPREDWSGIGIFTKGIYEGMFGE